MNSEKSANISLESPYAHYNIHILKIIPLGVWLSECTVISGVIVTACSLFRSFCTFLMIARQIHDKNPENMMFFAQEHKSNTFVVNEREFLINFYYIIIIVIIIVNYYYYCYYKN